MTRAEFSAILAWYLGYAADDSCQMSFSDVDPSNWAYYEILEASIEHNSEDFHIKAQ